MKDLKHKVIRGGFAKAFAQGTSLVLRMGSLMVLARAWWYHEGVAGIWQFGARPGTKFYAAGNALYLFRNLIVWSEVDARIQHLRTILEQNSRSGRRWERFQNASATHLPLGKTENCSP